MNSYYCSLLFIGPNVKNLSVDVSCLVDITRFWAGPSVLHERFYVYGRDAPGIARIVDCLSCPATVQQRLSSTNNNIYYVPTFTIYKQ